MSYVNVISADGYFPLRKFWIDFIFILIRSIPQYVLELHKIMKYFKTFTHFLRSVFQRSDDVG
jgi:hypothetical protein